MSLKKPHKPKEENKAEEPSSDYGDKSLRFFKSFEEMNDADYKERAETSPIDHLKYTVQLKIRTYKWIEQLRGKKISNNSIRIIRYE